MIGIVDSGIGGLSLLIYAKSEMPDKSYVYLADQANFPYGEKTEEKLSEIMKKNTEVLEKLGAKVILVACNSATVSVIDNVRNISKVPIVGVEPAIKVAYEAYPEEKKLLLSTTITASKHSKEKADYYRNTRVVPATQLVKLIENKFPKVTMADLKETVGNKMGDEKVVVLGCTHYHLVKNMLEEAYPGKIFLAPEEAIVKRLKTFSEASTQNSGDIFLTTGDLTDFKVKLRAIFGKDCDVRKI